MPAKAFTLTAENARTVACDQILRVSNTVGALDESAKPGERNGGLREWGLDPANKDQVTAVRTGLRERLEECQKAATSTPSPSATPSSTPSASSSPTATPSATGTPGTGVEQPDGSLVTLPIVGKPGESGPDNGDTTEDPRTPASFAQVREVCGPIVSWKNLVDCVDKAGADWYKGAVNDRAPKTGFSWSDVEKWANDPQLDDSSQLGIVVFGDIADRDARIIAGKLVGDELADKLAITRVPVGQWVNTRSVGHESVGDFVDQRTMVRVSLLPVLYNQDGTVDGLTAKSGILVDCLNIWWEVKRTWECKDSSCAPPPRPTQSPSNRPSPSPKPTKTTPLAGKKVSRDPANRDKVPGQVKGKAPATRKGHQQTAKPSSPPVTYTPPATPGASTKPTAQPTQSPAPGANDPGNGGRIEEPED